MQKRPSNSRPVKPIPSIEKRLGAYALTAAAAGAGLGLAAPSAEAKIIYTPADKVLTSGSFNIALNHIPMWTVTDGFRSSIGYDILSVKPLHGGGVMFAKGYAQALGSGASIGASGAFQTEPARMERAVFLSDSSFARGYGPWTNATNRYLGLRYVVNGQTHYGWARFTVKTTGNLNTGVKITATLTGYAIETVANQPIKAGATSGTENAANPVSLGCLAMGCVGLAFWRSPK
ncbi:MAG TPA: hypothetical protein VIH89_12855 [Candidatus Sulfotelmatobacter sp.]|jgi:hypothetical protein